MAFWEFLPADFVIDNAGGVFKEGHAEEITMRFQLIQIGLA